MHEFSSDAYVRLSCRVSSRIKHRAEEAAALLGQSITAFTESALAERAQAVFEKHERISLSERDFAQFVASLGNPKPPTEALTRAAKEYLEAHPEVKR